MASTNHSEQQAAYIERLGPPEMIRIGDLSMPVRGPTDLLVKVELVAANPVDTFIRAGSFVTPVPFPFVLGRDLVGTVVECNVESGFEQGETIWCNSLGHAGRQGSFARFAVVPEDRAYLVPKGVAKELVVAVAHPAATAFLGLFVHGELAPGDTAFIGGGAGNVGSAAVAMARRAGARVICSASSRDVERCASAGAEAVLDYHDPRLEKKLSRHVPRGVDLFWDTSGRHDLNLAARVCAPRARVVIAAVAGPPDVALPLRELYTRDLSVRGFVISRASVVELADAAALINDMSARGELAPRITEILPLAATMEVHRRFEAGQVRGRVLLQPDR